MRECILRFFRSHWVAVFYFVTFGSLSVGAAGSLPSSGGSIVAWGDTSHGATNVPADLTNVTLVAAGYNHSLALRNDGTVAAWGRNDHGQCDVPVGLGGVAGLAGGFSHSLALRSDGTVVAWGNNLGGQCDVPPGLTDVVGIAAGGGHSLAVKRDGTVVVWGDNSYFQLLVPTTATGVVAVAAGDVHSLALRSDGTVVAWAYGGQGQADVPAGLTDVVAIAAGRDHSVALKRDGTVVAWGHNGNGQTSVPAGLFNVAAIGAGGAYTAAIRTDGTVLTWGTPFVIPPVGLTNLSGISAVAGGEFHILALGAIPLMGGPQDMAVAAGGSATFSTVALGSGLFSYQWDFDGLPIPHATNATLTLINLTSQMAGNYSVRVSSSNGSVTSRTAKLVVTASADQFAGRRLVSGGGGRLVDTTVNAGKELGEPNHAGNAGGRSLWFAWTAPANTTVSLDTIGSSFDTLLAVYTGTALTNLALLAANDDGGGINFNSRLTFAATEGVTYLIAVDGYNGASGGVTLTVTPSLSIAGLTRTPSGELRFRTTGPGSSLAVIQGSMDLRTWTRLATNRLPESGVFQFADQTATNTLRRFYRAVVE